MAPRRSRPGYPLTGFDVSRMLQDGIARTRHSRARHLRSRSLENTRGHSMAHRSIPQHSDIDIDMSSLSLKTRPTRLASRPADSTPSERRFGRQPFSVMVPSEQRLMREALKLICHTRAQIRSIEGARAIIHGILVVTPARPMEVRENEKLKRLIGIAPVAFISDPTGNLRRNPEFERFFQAAVALDQLRDMPLHIGNDEGLEMIYVADLRAGIKELESTVKAFVETKKEQIEREDARAAHHSYVDCLSTPINGRLLILCRLLKIQVQALEDARLSSERKRRADEMMLAELSESMKVMRT